MATYPRAHLMVPLIAPITWSMHFTICYIWIAIACGRLDTGNGFAGARGGVALMTAIALTIAAGCFVYGWRQTGSQRALRSSDQATSGDRQRFMALATMLLAGLSMIGMVSVGVAVTAYGRCQ